MFVRDKLSIYMDYELLSIGVKTKNQMDGWMDGLMDRRTNGYTPFYQDARTHLEKKMGKKMI